MNQTVNIDSDELLGIYDDFVEQLTWLNEECPKIKKMYEDSQKSMAALSSDVAKQIKKIESQQQTIAILLAKITEAEGALTGLTEQIVKAENQKKNLESSLKSIETLTRKASAHLQKKKEESVFAVESTTEECLTKIHAIAKKAVASLAYEPEIDYSEINSIAFLYEKYGQHMKHPMLVKRSGWAEDSCFAVKEIKDGRAYGDQFKDGRQEFEGLNYPADDPDYSMFNGPSLDDIQEILSKS